MDLDPERIIRSPWLAGAFGSIVGLRWAPGLTWLERVFSVVCGSLCAGYGAPAIAEWWAINSPGMQAWLAFVVGMFGLSITAEAQRGFRELSFGDIVRDRLRDWFGGRRQ